MLRRALTLAVLAGMLAAPPAAQADAFEDVFADYQRDGRIDPCKHSPAELRTARRNVPSDIREYAPDFPDALDQALEHRAKRDCGKDEQPEQATQAAPGTTPPEPGSTLPVAPDPTAPAATTEAPGAPASVPQPPGTAQAVPVAADGAIVNAAAQTPDKGSDGIPAPLVALAIVGGLLLLALLLWGLARFFAWDPAWLASTRHAVQEAGWRVSALWDDFTDWLRPGRRAA